MEKLFITCVDSLVGANAAAVLSGRCDIASSSTSSTVEATIEKIVRERPTWVLHSGNAAWSSWDIAGVDGARCPTIGDLATEVDRIGAVAAACREVGARLVAVTSDAQFCGPRMFHEENGPSRARTMIAKQLTTLEARLCEADALVLRGHVYGWTAGGGATGYAERMFHSLTAELPCRVDARRHATPILATDFAVHAYEACRAGLRGVFNLTGAERTSPHRFAAELAATLGVPGRNVRLESLDEKSAARRLDETSLNIGAIRRRLNTALPMLREGLSRFIDQGFNGYRERLQATQLTSAIAPIAAKTLQAA